MLKTCGDPRQDRAIAEIRDVRPGDGWLDAESGDSFRLTVHGPAITLDDYGVSGFQEDGNIINACSWPNAIISHIAT